MGIVEHERIRSARKRAGFSLIEVMIAMMIMAIGLLTVALMQIHAMRDGSKGRHLSTAAMIARDQIEQVQRVPFSQIADKNFGDAEAWMAGVGLTRGAVSTRIDQVDGTQTVEQVYNVDWQIAPVLPVNADLKSIELAVTWQDKDTSAPHNFRLATVVVNNKR